MNILTIQRLPATPHGVFGVMSLNKIPFALTLENPWKNNIRDESCIPPGKYDCKRVISPRFGETFEVLKVSGRSHILFHKGNTMDDTAGCILVGEQFEFLDNRPAILHSGKGYGEFMSNMDGMASFVLKIFWGCGIDLDAIKNRLTSLSSEASSIIEDIKEVDHLLCRE
jgi:hypothetical protein